MPRGSRGSLVFIAGLGLSPRPMGDFTLPQNTPPRYRITGITRDAAGVELGDCAVEVYENLSGRLVAETVSDASGNYGVDVTSSETGLTFFAVAYKAGAPDVAGTTVNTLVGV